MDKVNAIDYWYKKYLKEKLTWGDIPLIEELINEVHNEYPCGLSAQCFGEEVIQRFNEQRNKK